MLEEAQAGDSDMALALNRYLFNAVLPLLTNYSHYFQEADHASSLLEQTLHTVYKMSKCRSLTKNQRDVVSDFLVALTRFTVTVTIIIIFQKIILSPNKNKHTFSLKNSSFLQKYFSLQN